MPGVRLLRIESGNKREACRHRTARGFSQFKANDSIAGCTTALPLPLDMARRALNNSLRGGRQALGNSNRGQPNNGMHLTGESGNVIRKVGCLYRFFPAGDAGR